MTLYNRLPSGWRASLVCCACVAALAVMATGCVRDDEPEGPCTTCPQDTLPADAVQVPVTLHMGTAWSVDDARQGAATKAAPPGHEPEWGEGGNTVDGSAEAAGTDEVRIIAFRRHDPDNQPAGSEVEPFLYDPSNDQTVPCAPDPAGSRYLVAEGTLTKVYGYQYRVVAIAYDCDRVNDESGGTLPATGEAGLFSLNLHDGLAYEDFAATFATGNVKDGWSGNEYWNPGGTVGTLGPDTDDLSPYAVYGPQLFYGFCHTGDGDPIIDFAVDNDKTLPLTGTLYRGLAKVEVRLLPSDVGYGVADYGVDWIGLLADHVPTQVGLTDYDDFLSPSTYLDTQGAVGDDGKYVLLAYQNVPNANDTVVLTAYVLPTLTRLALRIKASRIGVHMGWNAQINVTNISSADGGTGIISPDVHNGQFYFRRNHKYVLRGNTTKIYE